MLTRETFLKDMKAGWRELGYVSGQFYADKTGRDVAPEKAVSACAIGAASYGAKQKDPYEYARSLGAGLWDKIADASNNARNKTAAIRAVEAIQWP